MRWTCEECGLETWANPQDEAGSRLRHTCSEKRRADHQATLLRNSIDAEVAAFLESVEGKFAQYCAERERQLRG